MAGRVVEQFTASKTGCEDDNEDACVVTDRLAAVFDGETDKRARPPGAGGMPPGRAAAQAMADTAAGLLPDEMTAPEIAAALNAAVASARGDGAGAGCAAVGAVLDLRLGRIVRVGDVTVGIDGAFDAPHKKVDDAAGLFRAAVLWSQIAEGAGGSDLLASDPGRAAVLPLLRAAHRWRNHDPGPAGGGYEFGAFDGRPIPARFIELIEVPPGSEVVLCTDGYDDPRPTLAESEEALASSLEADPLRIAGPRPGTKGLKPGCVSFDDRSYVRVVF